MSNTSSRFGRPSSGRISVVRTAFGLPVRTAVLALAVALTVAVVPSVALLPSPVLADEYTDPVPATDPYSEDYTYTDPYTGDYTDPYTGDYTDPYTGDYTDPYVDPYAGEYSDPYVSEQTGQYSATEGVVPADTAGETVGATSGTGQAIVDFAMQYVGSPYVWAGNTPAGFDCSGFTQYVVQNVTGLDITHGTESQLAYGTPVAYDDLQPGDLVYFAGTWGPGVSHVGIYIGGGQIVHAENEMTGVKISDLWGGYDAYYYSAIRIG